MMLIYDKLYRTDDYKNIDLMEYVSKLIDDISSTFRVDGRNVIIKKDIGNFKIDSQIIFPLGIIINEIITNAFKHAFNGRSNGVIFVSVQDCGNTLELMIKDDGAGIPDSFDIKKTKGFGLNLVDILVQQMKGSLQITGTNGTEYSIVINI